MSFSIIRITFGSEIEAQDVSRVLLEAKLVACANIHAIQSMYYWEGALVNDREWVSILKAPSNNVADIETRVLQIHSYDTPSIVHWEVRANQAFEDWVHGNPPI